MEIPVVVALVAAIASLVVSVLTYVKERSIQNRRADFERTQNDLNRRQADDLARVEREARAMADEARNWQEREMAHLQHQYATIQTYSQGWLPKRLDAYVDFLKVSYEYAKACAEYGRSLSERKNIISARDDGVISGEVYEIRLSENATAGKPAVEAVQRLYEDIAHREAMIRMLGDEHVAEAAQNVIEGADLLKEHWTAWDEYTKPRSSFVARAERALSPDAIGVREG